MLTIESVIALTTLKKFVKHLPWNFVAGEITKLIAEVIYKKHSITNVFKYVKNLFIVMKWTANYEY